MSNRYKGGVISATPPTLVAGAGASGAWTLEQQMQATAAGLWPVNGPFFIEDFFNTYLYTGTGSTQTITNGIDLSTNGGLVWSKATSTSASHVLSDTANGVNKYLSSDTTSAISSGFGVTAFNTTGFNSPAFAGGSSIVSWTFRKQPKFFDIVTWTGTGSSPLTVSHNLGSVPGCIIIKAFSSSPTDGQNWLVYHRSVVNLGRLNETSAFIYSGIDNVTSASFQPGGTGQGYNVSGVQYIGYVFAHDAGGFGLTGSDNVISCGSYTGNGSGTAGTTVNLGYEPQWLLVKLASAAGENWTLYDVMRGMPVVSSDSALTHPLFPNTSDPDQNGYSISPLATGFRCNTTHISVNGSGQTYIYIAIRRGPMKVPTVGTSVYNGITRTGTGANATVTGAGFPVDLLFSGSRNAAFGTIDFDRLRGATQRLFTYSTAAEAARATSLTSFAVQDGYTVGDDSTDGGVNNSGQTYIYWNFRRAPSFFDEVCYTGTGSATTQTHNLGVVPELVIWKRRSSTSNWRVWQSSFSVNDGVYLDSTFAKDTDPNVQTAIPTATVLNLATGAYTNASGSTYVAYLFATCAGVSKVGSYTGTGAAQTINCGFTAGSRFVMIKRTDSTGDWYVWDSARGIIPSNDPYLLINSTAAEVTGTDYVDTTNVGFDITSTAPAAINANGGTFIFLAIA